MPFQFCLEQGATQNRRLTLGTLCCQFRFIIVPPDESCLYIVPQPLFEMDKGIFWEAAATAKSTNSAPIFNGEPILLLWPSLFHFQLT